jgi:carbonic anhydrase
VQCVLEILKVKHIIVFGHYGGGGVRPKLENRPHGLSDNWLPHIRDLYQRRSAERSRISAPEGRLNRLYELDAVTLTLQGRTYAISDGLLKDLEVSISSVSDLMKLGNI